MQKLESMLSSLQNLSGKINLMRANSVNKFQNFSSEEIKEFWSGDMAKAIDQWKDTFRSVGRIYFYSFADELKEFQTLFNKYLQIYKDACEDLLPAKERLAGEFHQSLATPEEHQQRLLETDTKLLSAEKDLDMKLMGYVDSLRP